MKLHWDPLGGVLRGRGEEQPCMLKIRATVLSRASPYLLPTPAQALGHGRFICCAARAAPHGPPWPSSARFNIYRYGGTEKFHCGAQTLLLLSIIHVPNTFFTVFAITVFGGVARGTRRRITRIGVLTV